MCLYECLKSFVYQNDLEKNIEILVSGRSISNGSSLKIPAKHEYQ
jgi:hypothetical protein